MGASMNDKDIIENAEYNFQIMVRDTVNFVLSFRAGKDLNGSRKELDRRITLLKELESNGMLMVLEQTGEPESKKFAQIAKLLLDWGESRDENLLKDIVVEFANNSAPEVSTSAESERLSELYNQFNRPYVKAVSDMRLTQIGNEAENIDSKLKSLFKKKDGAKAAEQFLAGLHLRIAKNRLKVMTEKELEVNAKKRNVDLDNLTIYHLVDETYTIVSTAIYDQTGVIGLDNAIKQLGFMKTVMQIVEIGNNIISDNK